jgi:hypothetical protein
MPFRRLDDLLHLIEDGLPRQARVVLAKANALMRGHAESRQHERPVMLNVAEVDRIVGVMLEPEYRGDPDNMPAKKKAMLPHFMLRH